VHVLSGNSKTLWWRYPELLFKLRHSAALCLADCRYTPAATDGYLPPDVQLAQLEAVQGRHDDIGGDPGLAVIRALLVRGNLVKEENLHPRWKLLKSGHTEGFFQEYPHPDPIFQKQ